MLNDVNLSKNINRYYLIQVLKLPNGFQFFRHEGKVGQDNESIDLSSSNWWGKEGGKTYNFTTQAEAVAEFKAWFFKKTSNDWDMRHVFRKMPGGYGFVELSTVNKDAILQAKGGGATSTAPCSLGGSVADLVDLMFDEDIIMHSLKEVGVNLDEMPLGAVTAEVVDKARGILDQVKQHLESAPVVATSRGAAAQAKAVTATQVWESQLRMHSEAFYLAIPSTDASLIADKPELDKKVALINMLGDIALTQKALKKQRNSKNAAAKSTKAAAAVADPHPLDEKYTSLGCGLKKLPKTDPVWKGISQYFKASVEAKKLVKDPYGMSGFSKRHGSKVKLLEVFEMT